MYFDQLLCAAGTQRLFKSQVSPVFYTEVTVRISSLIMIDDNDNDAKCH